MDEITDIFVTSTPVVLPEDGTQGANDVTRSLFRLSLILQAKIFIWLLALSGLLFIIGLIMSLVEVLRRKNDHDRKQKWSCERLRRMSRIVNWGSTAMALAAAVGVTQASSSLQIMSDSFPDSVIIRSGLVSQVLHWLIVSLSFTITIGRSIMRPLKSPSQDGSEEVPMNVSRVSRWRKTRGYLGMDGSGSLRTL